MNMYKISTGDYDLYHEYLLFHINYFTKEQFNNMVKEAMKEAYFEYINEFSWGRVEMNDIFYSTLLKLKSKFAFIEKKPLCNLYLDESMTDEEIQPDEFKLNEFTQLLIDCRKEYESNN